MIALLLLLATPVAGDLVFQESESGQSQAIRLATGSRYTHVGVVLEHHGRRFVFEAVEPVRYTPLEAWIARGVGGHYVAKRLESGLSPESIEKLNALAAEYLGRAYDWSFEWSDRRFYCSELVHKLFERAAGVQLAKPKRLGDFALEAPAVKKKLKERYGDKVPLDEPMVSPQQLFESPLLVEVDRTK